MIRPRRRAHRPRAATRMHAVHALVFAGMFAVSQAWAEEASTPPDILAELRTLAAGLHRQGPRRDVGLALEYQINRHTNTCTNHQPEIRMRVFGDGRLELFRTRSHAESDLHGPGSFQGKVDKAALDSLFLHVSRMKWESMPFGLPMPGMSESHQVVLLHHAGRTATFDLTGAVPPGQALIEDGLGAVSRLLQHAKKDTLWSLGLSASRAKRKGSLLSVQSSWSLRGSQPLKFRLPLGDAPPACGSMELRWFAPGKREKGVTPLPPDIHRAKLKQAPIGAGEWKELRPGDSLVVKLQFLLAKPQEKARGDLTHLGFPVSLAGKTDTLATVTLFSGHFDF